MESVCRRIFKDNGNIQIKTQMDFYVWIHRPKYYWDEFDNAHKLTEYQKLRIKMRFKRESKSILQEIINDSVSAKKGRRSELDAHNDPNNPFNLDIGGQG